MPSGPQREKQIYAYFEDLIRESEKTSRDDLMGYLTRVELDGEKLSRNEILDISFLFILAGLDTVTATLSCCTAYLAANLSQRERITREPDSLEPAIEEMLRWETPVSAIPRLVKQNVEIAGTSIKEGEMILLLLGAANIDPSEFETPENVDFDRARNRHIAFGGRRASLSGLPPCPDGTPGRDGRVAPSHSELQDSRRRSPRLQPRHPGHPIPAPCLELTPAQGPEQEESTHRPSVPSE